MSLICCLPLAEMARLLHFSLILVEIKTDVAAE